MKFRRVLARVFVGVFFAVSGYLFSYDLLPKKWLGIPYIFQVLAAFILGAIGILVVPMATKFIANLAGKFGEVIAKEVARQMRTLEEIRERRRKLLKKKTAKNGNGELFNPIIVDTSCLIDGRIVDIVKTGFLSGTFLVPKGVLSELRHVADSSEQIRRQRGRRGLDALEEVKKMGSWVKVKVVSDEEIKGKEVDEKIVELAKKYKARILTVDFNLNKTAKVSGVAVLNVNELANSVKTVVLPGEKLTIKVVQEGKEEGQGVGYLDDGTMVVIENGNSLVGQETTIEISRVLQTAAGKICFGRIG